MGAFGKMGLRPWLFGTTAAVVCMIGVTPVYAQTKAFDVPEQAAAQGIPQFGKQAGIQILASATTLEGKRTKAVKGSYSVNAGLAVLLEGTGLEAVPDDASGIITVRPSPAAVAAADDETVVVVTAQKRKEPLQKVPASIQVVSGDKIDQQAIDSYKDVIQMMSGVTIREHSDARNIGLVIRGVGSNQSFIGIEPDAAVNLDGEVMSRSSALFGDIGDTDSVAVLKGPQGTLFGKNSVAGVLQIKTKRPSLKGNEGSFRLNADEGTTETFGEVNASGMYNYVINDTSAVRVNLFKKRDSGWVENVLGGPNGGKSDGYGGRIQYLKRFGEDTDLLLRADYQESNFGPSTRVYIQRDDFTIGNAFGQIPQSVIDSLHLSPEALQNMLTTTIHRVSQTPYGQWNDKTSASGSRDYGGTHSFGTSGELTHRYGNGFELTGSAFYRDETLASNDDSLTTAVNAFRFNFAGPVRSKTFQTELRIASPIGGKLDYVAGFYYLHSKVRRDQKVLACQDPGLDNSVIDADYNVVSCGGYAFDWGVSNPGVTGLGDLIYNREIRNNNLITDNAALFAQGNYHLSDKWTVVAGGRLLREHQRFSLDTRDDGLANVDVRPTLLWINDADGNRITLDGRRFFVANPFLGLPSSNPATNLDVRDPNSPFKTATKGNDDTAFTYKLSLLYQPTRNVMTYLNYSTGYKGVAWFTDSDVNQATLDSQYPIAPETSQNIELGLRSQWFDRRLTFNATLFDTTFYHYQDRLVTLDYNLWPTVNGGLQNIANDPTASGQPIRKFSIIDTGNLTSKGVDVEMSWRMFDHFTVSANYSHVDARFSNTNVLITCNAAAANGVDTSTCTAPINYGEFFDYTFPRRGRFFSLDGAQLANAPKDTLATDAVLNFDMGQFPAYIRWNYRYASEQYTNHGGKANNDYSTTTPAYGIHNLFVGVSSPSGKYRLNLYVKNLFDKHYYVYKTNYGDGLSEQAVGGSLTTVPELVGIAQAYPTYGAVPNGQFFRQRAENANVPRDFSRYIGATFEMSF